MPADGTLAEILVRPGDRVKAGQVLARLGDPEMYAAAASEARLDLLDAQKALEDLRAEAPLMTAQAQAALVEAEKKLAQEQSRRLSKQYQRATDETIDIARANLILAENELDRAEQIYQIHQSRAENDPERAAALSRLAAARQEYNRHKANLDYLISMPSDLEIEQADAAVAVAEAELAIAQAAWDQVKDGPDALALEQAQVKVDQAVSRLALAESVAQNVEIKAPFDGVVAELQAKTGSPLASGAVILTVLDPAQVEVEASVVEEEFPLLEVGMSATVFFDALPDEILSGRVVSIIPRRIEGDRPRYSIRISLDRVPEKLAGGMTADASIVLASREDVLCLPRGLVRASGEGLAQVEVWDGVSSVKREITVGLRGDQNVEILSGLALGDLVVTQ
jgi:HlyD family secretion protein